MRPLRIKPPSAAPQTLPASGSRFTFSWRIWSGLSAGGLMLVVTLIILWSTPHPPCDAAVAYVQVITDHEQAARWELARSSAELALQTPNLCSETHAALSSTLIATGMEALYSESFNPTDATAQQRIIDQYEQLHQQAIQNGVAFPSSQQTALRAYQIGQFPLVIHILEAAFLSGEIDASSRDQLQRYSSALYNTGWWWATKGTPQQRKDGLRMLVTSARIDEQYRLGSGAAWGALHELIGPDTVKWPPPAASPLLDSENS